MDIVIQKREQVMYDGAWRDPALSWAVKGPNEEQQNFRTKRHAEIYRRCRLKAENWSDASNMFSQEINYGTR